MTAFDSLKMSSTQYWIFFSIKNLASKQHFFPFLNLVNRQAEEKRQNLQGV